MNDLEIERRTALFLRIAARGAANFRQTTADVSRVEFVDQTKAVTFVRAERQERNGFRRVRRRVAVFVTRPNRRRAVCLRA
jgi:hypothetical protein